MKRQIINKGLRVPAADSEGLRTLTSHDIETRAVHAARFHENWISGHPRVKRSQKFTVKDTINPNRLTCVRFLKSRKGELVLTVVNGRVIMCWEVPLGLRTEPLKIAQWDELDLGFIVDIVVNEDPNSPALFAIAVHTALERYNHSLVERF